MDLGLGNLITLKRHLINASTDETRWDAVIADVGLGVSRGIETYCNRKFAREAGAVDYFPADVQHCYLPRYPIESVSQVALRTSLTDGYVAQDSSVIINRDDRSGLLVFGGIQGEWWGQIKVTYTGGYWYDTTEDASGVMPDDATLLPGDVKLAWLTQCRRLWDLIDKLGTGIAQLDRNRSAEEILSSFELVEGVKQMLNGHIRYAMT